MDVNCKKMISETIKENIESLSDRDLIDVFVNKRDYREEALQFASEEIKRRNIDQKYYEKEYGELEIKYKEKLRKEEQDLTRSEKISLSFFSIRIIIALPIALGLLPPVPSSRVFHEKGYKKKASKVIWYKIFSYIWWPVLIACFLYYPKIFNLY